MFGCAVLTGVGAVANAGKLKAGNTVAIVGLGGVGVAALMGAVALEASFIVAIDRRKEKLELALQLGADAAFDASDVELVDRVRSLTGGGVDVAVELAGTSEALTTAWELTRPGGVTVTAGLPSANTKMFYSPTRVVAEERTLVGSYLGSGNPAIDVPNYIRWYESGRLPVDRLISSHLQIEEINSGFDLLAEAQGLRHILTLGHESDSVEKAAQNLASLDSNG